MVDAAAPLTSTMPSATFVAAATVLERRVNRVISHWRNQRDAAAQLDHAAVAAITDAKSTRRRSSLPATPGTHLTPAGVDTGIDHRALVMTLDGIASRLANAPMPVPISAPRQYRLIVRSLSRPGVAGTTGSEGSKGGNSRAGASVREFNAVRRDSPTIC